MNILLSGYYGFGNAGDEFILQYISYFLAQRYDASIYALSFDAAYSHSLINNIKFIDRNDFKKIADILSFSDLSALGGGGLFQDYDKIEPSALFAHPEYGVQSYANVPILSKIYKRPVAYLFQGVGPFFSPDAKSFARFAFSLADYISVRDVASYKTLVDIKCENAFLSADPIFLTSFNKHDGKGNKSRRVKIGISLRRWAFGNLENHYIDIMTKFVNKIIDFGDVYFFSFQDLDEHNNDSYIYYKIREKINYCDRFSLIRFKDCSLDEFEQKISAVDFFVGMRYHSIALAAKHNVPFIALSYWNKVYELSKDFFLDKYCIDIYHQFSFDDMIALFDSLIKNKSILKEKMCLGMRKIKKRIANGVESFDFFLDKWGIK